MPDPPRRDPLSSLLVRRRWTRLGIAAAVGMLLLIVGLDQTGLLRRMGLVRPAGVSNVAGDDHTTFDRKAFVVKRVVDGDTVEIEHGGDTTSVRMIGLDAPEMNYKSNSPPEHWAREAMEHLRSAAQGKTVILRLEPMRTRDRYGRLLAYLYLGDDRSLNLEMVMRGHAYADRRFSHTMAVQFASAEDTARRKKQGLWEGVTPRQMPAWRRDWLTGKRKDAGG